MAISIRRALASYRSISGALRATNFTADCFSSLVGSNSSPFPHSVTTETIPCSLQTDYLLEIRRGFAKGRRQAREEVDDDDYGNPAAAVNIGPSIKAAAVSQMEAAIDALSRELAKLRTGRASAGILDHIIVESGGVKTPLCRMAVISVLDPKTLSVTPYDPNTVKELDKAIVSSPLGLNPQVDNQRLIVPIPPLTKEHVQAVCKVVAKSSEDVKQSVRRARQKNMVQANANNNNKPSEFSQVDGSSQLKLIKSCEESHALATHDLHQILCNPNREFVCLNGVVQTYSKH